MGRKHLLPHQEGTQWDVEAATETERLQLCSVQVLQSHGGKPSFFIHHGVVCLSIRPCKEQAATYLVHSREAD